MHQPIFSTAPKSLPCSTTVDQCSLLEVEVQSLKIIHFSDWPSYHRKVEMVVLIDVIKTSTLEMRFYKNSFTIN
jgi:hypothetical protein